MKKQDSCNRTASENPGTIILYMICILGGFTAKDRNRPVACRGKSNDREHIPDESTLVHLTAQGKVLHKLPENASSDREKFIILHTTPDHLFGNRRFQCFRDLSAARKCGEQLMPARHSVCPCNAHEMPARAGCLTDTPPPSYRPFGCPTVVNSYLASQSPKKTAKNCTSVQTPSPALDNLRPEGYIIKCIESDPY